MPSLDDGAAAADAITVASDLLLDHGTAAPRLPGLNGKAPTSDEVQHTWDVMLGDRIAGGGTIAVLTAYEVWGNRRVFEV